MAEPDVASLAHRLAALTRRATGERMAQEDWAHRAKFRSGCIGVLHVVAAREPISQREISDALLLDPSDVVTLVDILEGAGLVDRKRDPADRRRYALEVTTRGKLAVARLKEINREVSDELLAPLDAEERSRLAGLMARVVQHHTGAAAPDADRPAAAPDAAARAGAAPKRTLGVEDLPMEGPRPGQPVMPGHPERLSVPDDPAGRHEAINATASRRPPDDW